VDYVSETEFAALHRRDTPLLLPNAWDHVSAALNAAAEIAEGRPADPAEPDAPSYADVQRLGAAPGSGSDWTRPVRSSTDRRGARR
jgi:hypothetical protein